MSIAQFFRILFARRLIIFVMLMLSLAVAVALCLFLPTKYTATARVLMNVIQPDPVSGQVISSSFVRGYSKTQIELITDYRVAGDVVDRLNWDKNPILVADYQAHNDGSRDFRRYWAQKIIDDTDAQLVEGSNILEISYKGGNSTLSRNVVTALRASFIDASLRFRTDSAGRSAEWYVNQAAKAQAALSAAEGKKSEFERTNGIVMAPGGADSETMKLEAMQSALMSARGSAGMVAAGDRASSAEVEQLKTQLNAIDDAIAQASQKLGTSHPNYIAMVERRKIVEQQMAKAKTAAAAGGGVDPAAISRSNTGRMESELAAQKEKVLALKPKLDELAQLQREVDLRKVQYEKAAVRAADLKLESDVSETGLVPLGDALAEGSPSFPNKPLILALGVIAGLTLGIIAAVATELVSRRIRGPEDLANAANAAVLAVIADTAPVSFVRRIRRLFGRESTVGTMQAAQ